MKLAKYFSLLIVTAMLLTIPTTVLAGWARACHGRIPSGAEPQGYEASGEYLWIARANMSSNGRYAGTHPGKVRPAFNAANIPYGGREIAAKCYEVWVGPARWVKAANGRIPSGAIAAGREAGGEPLYVARGIIKGGLHIGKVRPGFGAANIPYGGKELKVRVYEVLCY